MNRLLYLSYFFFTDTAPTEIYTVGNTLSLHDALPISWDHLARGVDRRPPPLRVPGTHPAPRAFPDRRVHGGGAARRLDRRLRPRLAPDPIVPEVDPVEGEPRVPPPPAGLEFLLQRHARDE